MVIQPRLISQPSSLPDTPTSRESSRDLKRSSLKVSKSVSLPNFDADDEPVRSCSSECIVVKKREPIQWVVSRHYHVSRKVVVRSLEALDSKDSPDHPGLLYEETLRETVHRFDAVFGMLQAAESRGRQVEGVMDHLRRHTRRRRGEAVLKERYVEWEQTSRVYELFTIDLNMCERIFFTVDVGESSAVLSKICSFILIFSITISIGTWMVSTLPSMQSIEESCISIEVGKCAPEPANIFGVIESVSVIIFTVEYLVRLLTVHSVRFALLNEVFMEAVLTRSNVEEVQFMRSETMSQSTPDPTSSSGSRSCTDKSHPQKLDGKLKTLFVHCTGFANVIDLLAILPWWLEFFGFQGGGGFLVVLRVLRVTRIFRVFKLGKYNDVFTLFSGVIKQSTPALLLMVFFIILGCCLFGTLMWFAEAGTWYPEGNPVLSPLEIVGRGAWLRHTGSQNADDLEESPFQSIVHSFWYVVVTITTTGYGDVGPTTVVGKLIASVTILHGIIVLAMPIGIVGANFGSEYYRVLDDKKRRRRLNEQNALRAALEEQEDKALNEEQSQPGEQREVVSLPDETVTELQRVDVARKIILMEAEQLDKNWKKLLPLVMYSKLSDSLRGFVSQFIGNNAPPAADSTHGCGSTPEVTGFGGKPKIQLARLLDLDVLSAQVNKAISTVQTPDEFAEDSIDCRRIGLKDSSECRRTWVKFTDNCWEYATTKCIIEKRQDPPEYFHMKTRLATKL